MQEYMVRGHRVRKWKCRAVSETHAIQLARQAFPDSDPKTFQAKAKVVRHKTNAR